MNKKVIMGSNPDGKKILILGGVHGDELTPIYTLSNMVKNEKFNKEDISKLTILNAVNVSALKKSQREFHNENSNDLNRLLISNETPNSSDVIKELKTYIEQADVVIDVHSSPNCTEFALIDIDQYTNTINSWCLESDVTTVFRYSAANTIKRYCLEQGKLAVTLEVNKMKLIDFESSERLEKDIHSLIYYSTHRNVFFYKNSHSCMSL
jgi:predicted deacylase